MACKPRVIGAEIKKDPCKDVIQDKPGSKPHIAGVVSLVGGTSSEPHYAEVRDGQLLLYPGASPSAPPVWRLPLRHLHLQPAASGRPRGFSLTRHNESTPIATFQVDSELEYSRWVKTLAAELLKQTPLDAVKYLDILGITASLPRPTRERESRSLSPVYPYSLGSEEPLSWELRCSPLPRTPRTWPPPSVTQPLSLVITEEPKASRRQLYKKALTFDSSPEDSVDGRYHVRMVDSICQLAKQSKNCFRSCAKNKDKITQVDENGSGKNRVKSLLKTFLTQDSAPELTSPAPLHPLDMKDDGRTRRPPLPDVIKDLPPCDRKSRTRTRTPTRLRLRGKSVDVLPSSEDDRVAELIAHCRQEDKYVSVKEKRLLFESLGRAASQPRFVLSSDNLTSLDDLPPEPAQPRTQSLHDLSGNNVAVKEICRYFEQRGESRRARPPARSPSPECRLRLSDPPSRRPLGRLQQHRAGREATVWRFREQGCDLSRNTRDRGSGCLQEDRESLKRLQDGLSRLQRRVDTAPEHFGILAPKVRHHSDVR